MTPPAEHSPSPSTPRPSGHDWNQPDADRQGRGPSRAVHPAALPDAELLRACTIERGRIGGPGGQHRNKVETAITLTHRPTGLSAQAAERRSPAQNQRLALRRLRLALATSVRLGVPAGEIRSELWRSRTAQGRIAVNPAHRDFPALLAEALDVLFAARLDVRRAATRLGVSPTQLVRLVAKHPPALAELNRARVQRKLRPMHP